MAARGLFHGSPRGCGLSDLTSATLCDNRRGKSIVHRLDGLFRQSVFGRLAGYKDVNDADRLAVDPVIRQVVPLRSNWPKWPSPVRWYAPFSTPSADCKRHRYAYDRDQDPN